MRPTKNAHAALDRAGIVASSLCAVHCALFSLLPVVSAVTSRLVAAEWLERLLVMTAVLLGLASLLSSFLLVHRDVRPLSLLTTGLLALMARSLVSERGACEVVCSIVAACFLVSAHLYNLRVTRCCDHCCPR
jgi:hypothetical protein